jgi:microcystin degradation protein MlrC
MTRIAVGGFLHETNTFAPTKATYADFVHGGGWPSMAHGPDVLEVMKTINVGLAGFAEQAAANGWEMVPTISCGASPGPRDQRRVRTHRHGDDRRHRRCRPARCGLSRPAGAMVTEHYDDSEGEFWRACAR